MEDPTIPPRLRRRVDGIQDDTLGVIVMAPGRKREERPEVSDDRAPKVSWYGPDLYSPPETCPALPSVSRSTTAGAA